MQEPGPSTVSRHLGEWHHWKLQRTLPSSTVIFTARPPPWPRGLRFQSNSCSGAILRYESNIVKHYFDLFRIGLESLGIPTPSPTIHHPTSLPSCCFIPLKLHCTCAHARPKVGSSMSLLRFRYILKIPNSSSDIKSDSDLMHVLFRLFGDVITSFPLHHGTPLWQCCSDVHSDLTCEGACQIQWIGRENLHRKPWDKMGGCPTYISSTSTGEITDYIRLPCSQLGGQTFHHVQFTRMVP